MLNAIRKFLRWVCRNRKPKPIISEEEILGTSTPISRIQDKICQWAYDSEHNVINTSCGNIHDHIENPTKRHCKHCGGKIDYLMD